MIQFTNGYGHFLGMLEVVECGVGAHDNDTIHSRTRTLSWDT